MAVEFICKTSLCVTSDTCSVVCKLCQELELGQSGDLLLLFEFFFFFFVKGFSRVAQTGFQVDVLWPPSASSCDYSHELVQPATQTISDFIFAQKYNTFLLNFIRWKYDELSKVGCTGRKSLEGGRKKRLKQSDSLKAISLD